MQLTLDMGTLRVPQQALLGSRTTRMIAGDLRDLEREVAVATTQVFKETGISYPREDLELEMFNDMHSISGIPPRMELEPTPDHWFPDQISLIDRRMHERVGLLKRLMKKSKSWEAALADIAGNVNFMCWVDNDFLNSPAGRKALRSGRIMEAAEKAGKVTRQSLGMPGNPWECLAENPMAFPDPMCFDAMFSPEVDPEDIQVTRDYRDLRPWFLDDIEEELVAQWMFDHTGMPPWRGSMDFYMMTSKLNQGIDVDEGDWPEFHRVVSAAQLVQEYRQNTFKVELDTRPRQQHLIRGDR